MSTPPNPLIIKAFDRLFASMGITAPEEKAETVRRVFASETLQTKLQALEARLIAEEPGRPRQRKPKEP